jgi:hypothetical protein
MPLVAAGLMLLAFGGLVRTEWVAKGQISVFGLSGESAEQRRALLHRLAWAGFVLGAFCMLAGLLVIVRS